MNEKIDVAYFTDFMHYEIINKTSVMQEITNKLCEDSDGMTTSTSSWMNRYNILSNGNVKYIIVPSYKPCEQNNRLATSKPFLLFSLKEEDGKVDFDDFTEIDALYFQSKEDEILSEKTLKENTSNYMVGMEKAVISTEIAMLLIETKSKIEIKEMAKKADSQDEQSRQEVIQFVVEIFGNSLQIDPDIMKEIFLMSVKKADALCETF